MHYCLMVATSFLNWEKQVKFTIILLLLLLIIIIIIIIAIIITIIIMITCCKCRYRPRPGPPLAGREEALSWKSKRLRKCFESLKIVLEMQMIKKMFWDVTETQMIFHISYLWSVFRKIGERDLRAQFQNFFTSKKLEQSFIFLVFVWSFLPERR